MLATVLAAGCGTKTVGNLDDGSDSGGSSEEGTEGHTSMLTQSTSATTDTDSASESVSTSASGTVSATVSDSGSDATDTDTTTGECPPDGGSICDPQRMLEPAEYDWSIDDNQEFEVELVDTPCMVADFQDDGLTMTIELQCDEMELASHTIVLPHNAVTPLNIGTGSSVLLTYYAQTPFWSEYWFALRTTDGRLIIGATNASGLLPVDDLFAPLVFDVHDDVCPAECSDDKCGATRRFALGVTLDANEMTVYDGNRDVIGDTTNYAVVVGQAAGFVDFGVCTDIPGAWFSVIVYDTTEG
jgi:hypothetical protein